MLKPTALVLLAAALIACAPPAARGHETDQFTTPAGREFADLGDYFNRWIYDLIERGVDRANLDIRNCLDHGGDPALLSNLHDPGHLVNCVHDGMPWSVDQIETFDRFLLSEAMWRRYPGRLVAYMESDRNIYQYAFFPLDIRITSRWFYSPTVKVYGVYLGTDKLGHFTDLGVSYYWQWRAARDRGANEEEAVATAVRVGTEGPWSEAGLLGTLANGDYSNGDLAANFAGFLFYRNLGEWTAVQGVPRPPMVERDGPYWRIADHVRRDSNFFAMFVSEHLDEALNPGLFDEGMRPALRDAVRERAASILWRYRAPDGRPRSRTDFEDKLDELSTYWGIDYGHRGRGDDLVSIANACFAAPHRGSHAPPHFPEARSDDDAEVATAQPLRASAGTMVRIASAASSSGSIEKGTRVVLLPGAQAAGDPPAMAAALHDAAARGDVSAVRQLLRANVEIGKRDEFGRTALHDAASAGSTDIIALLLRAGASAGAMDAYGTTPLHLACRHGHQQAAAALLAGGADVNARSAAGVTAMHEAALSGDLGVVRLLMTRAALPIARDHRGRTPADVARAHGYADVVRLLTKAAKVARPTSDAAAGVGTKDQ